MVAEAPWQSGSVLEEARYPDTTFRQYEIDCEPLDSQLGQWPKQLIPEAVQPLLFPLDDNPRMGTFALLDAARIPNLRERLDTTEIRYTCLFNGAAAAQWGHVAPWLVQLKPDSRLLRPLFSDSGQPGDLWHSAAAVFLRSTSGLGELRAHFRKFTKLYDPERERMMFFRFYAPETLRTLIAALPPQRLQHFARPIDSFVTYAAHGRGIFVLAREKVPAPAQMAIV